MTKPKHPDLIPVESSAMKAVHYDQDTRDLHIEFPGGAVWLYPDVSAERGTAFMESASKGKYFANQIKPFHAGKKVS